MRLLPARTGCLVLGLRVWRRGEVCRSREAADGVRAWFCGGGRNRGCILILRIESALRVGGDFCLQRSNKHLRRRKWCAVVGYLFG